MNIEKFFGPMMESLDESELSELKSLADGEMKTRERMAAMNLKSIVEVSCPLNETEKDFIANSEVIKAVASYLKRAGCSLRIAKDICYSYKKSGELF